MAGVSAFRVPAAPGWIVMTTGSSEMTRCVTVLYTSVSLVTSVRASFSQASPMNCTVPRLRS